MPAVASASDGRVVIIAGGGNIPLFVAETLAEQGRNPFIVALEGEADPAVSRFEHEYIHTSHIGVLLSILERVRPADVVMVGSAKQRPSLWRIRPDWTTFRLAAKFLPKLKSGDDSLLRGVVEMIEEAGFRVRGVHELVPELLASEGHIAGPAPTAADGESIATAVNGALALGRLDAGQACVAIGRRIVALEGAEGTDQMLLRVAELRKEGRIPDRRGGVLVKLAKPGQEIRADLPTIGRVTVQNAHAAKLKGICVHAGRALISDHDATCAKAEELGIFLHGIHPETTAGGTGRQ
ncbi:LpxI family protein [Oricola indica]|jgi:DUF1009 family protein|uniref:LpxI family protein n=1 Tax=Oricola indica TaxID=2872591 RepID=UPI001CC123CC|nr:UDP-2,3-diacylglucosamine diphosphatase LpxI [Oricola indica]